MDPDGVIESSWNEVVHNFDDMDLKEELLRGIYAYGYERPSAIQQRAILPCIKERDVIAQAQSGRWFLLLLFFFFNSCSRISTPPPTREPAGRPAFCGSGGGVMRGRGVVYLWGVKPVFPRARTARIVSHVQKKSDAPKIDIAAACSSCTMRPFLPCCCGGGGGGVRSRACLLLRILQSLARSAWHALSFTRSVSE